MEPYGIEVFGEHEYLLQLRQGDTKVTIRFYAAPEIVAQVLDGSARRDLDEQWVVRAAVAFLLNRQRADELPSMLDMAEVADAYDGFVGDLMAQATSA